MPELLREMLTQGHARPLHSDQIRDTFDTEEDQAEYELNYRPPYRDTRFFKTHPAGYNVVRSLGAVFALGGWVATVFVAALFSELKGFAGVGAVIAGLIVGLTLGFTLPEILWRGVGSTIRSALRPLGWFGGLPMIFLCLCLFAVFAGVLRLVIPQPSDSSATPSSQSTPLPKPAPVVWKGSDWQILLDANGKPREMPRQDALTACSALGPGWRLPLASDTAWVLQRLKTMHGGILFHADGPLVPVPGTKLIEKPFLMYRWPDGWIIDYTRAESTMKVLCIRP
ncbi:MAG TPA: hypothetical protein PKO06_14865 [Candidatus Ozemobacteraceae bacterium]|nr:hypothetical protein [Candidatus Ozemobacteraceae bacterium]